MQEEPTAHTHKHLHDAQEPAMYFEILDSDYNKYEKQVLNKTLDPWWDELPKADLTNYHLHERAVMNSVCSLQIPMNSLVEKPMTQETV